MAKWKPAPKARAHQLHQPKRQRSALASHTSKVLTRSTRSSVVVRFELPAGGSLQEAMAADNAESGQPGEEIPETQRPGEGIPQTVAQAGRLPVPAGPDPAISFTNSETSDRLRPPQSGQGDNTNNNNTDDTSTGDDTSTRNPNTPENPNNPDGSSPPNGTPNRPQAIYLDVQGRLRLRINDNGPNGGIRLDELNLDRFNVIITGIAIEPIDLETQGSRPGGGHPGGGGGGGGGGGHESQQSTQFHPPSNLLNNDNRNPLTDTNDSSFLQRWIPSSIFNSFTSSPGRDPVMPPPSPYS